MLCVSHITFAAARLVTALVDLHMRESIKAGLRMKTDGVGYSAVRDWVWVGIEFSRPGQFAGLVVRLRCLRLSCR